MKKTIFDFQRMKKEGEKIAGIVVYDFHNAEFGQQAEVDWLLVGDSVAMSIYGHKSTIPATMEQMIVHTEAVRRGAANTFLVGDMPFMSYQRPEDALYNAGLFYKKAGVDAVKVEGSCKRVVRQIEALVRDELLVMGHIGLTPQSTAKLGGYKVQGKTADEACQLIRDAKALEDIGIFALLVEAVPPEVTKIIAQLLRIPVLSIGAGPYCGGQLLLDIDLLGKSKVFTPKFVKIFTPQAIKILESRGLDKFGIGDITLEAFNEYVREVKEGKFPSEEHCYKMKEGEYEKLKKILEQKI